MVSGHLILSLVVLGSTTSTLAAPIPRPLFGSIVDKVKGLFNGPGNTAAPTTLKAEETPLSRIAQFARSAFHATLRCRADRRVTLAEHPFVRLQ